MARTLSALSVANSADTSHVEAARQVGLRYVTDDIPGILRIAGKNGFVYRLADGKTVKDDTILQRIRSLAIPPAWRDVWICAQANGHLQATGRDAKGRKQYRYHPDWRRVRDETKYERMIGFGRVLPEIRKQVDKDMALPGLPREKALATVVHLLQTTLMRIGNEEYARTNQSFGLTTLRGKHVQVKGSTVQLSFRGKSGVAHAIRLSDRRLARIVKRMQELPGQALIQYEDEEGALHPIGSAEVNEYLRTISGDDYTAKDFRTWAGTMLAALELRECEDFNSETEARRNISAAIEQVAVKLGNTPAICRKCYVHPVVIDAYMDRSIVSLRQAALAKDCSGHTHELSVEETSIITLLQEKMADTAASKTSPSIARAASPDKAKRTKTPSQRAGRKKAAARQGM